MLSTEAGNENDASTGGFCASLQWGGVQGGETERGKRQYKCVTAGQSKGGKSAIEQKKCSRSEHSRVVRDVGRTELGLQKGREKTDGDHRVLKTLETQAAFLVCSRSLFS